VDRDTEMFPPVPEVQHPIFADLYQMPAVGNLSLLNTPHIHPELGVSSSSKLQDQSRFIMWKDGGGASVIKGPCKPRRCMICVKAGQEGYGCTGRNYGSMCPLFS